MRPKSIGIVAGAGGPLGSSYMLQEIIAECQIKYGCWRSYEYPCFNLFSFPYSEMMFMNQSVSHAPAKELGYSIQQLKLSGMEIVVIPCFTIGSFLKFRNYGVELVEAASVVQAFLDEHGLKRPLVLCSERTRNSGYCEKYFECRYPNQVIQREIETLIEKALCGENVDVKPLLDQLPFDPIVCASQILNAQMKGIKDPRWINSNQLLAQWVVNKSYG